MNHMKKLGPEIACLMGICFSGAMMGSLHRALKEPTPRLVYDFGSGGCTRGWFTVCLCIRHRRLKKKNQTAHNLKTPTS